MKLHRHFLFCASSITVLVLVTGISSGAQIVPDATLSEPSVVTLQDATYIITGGTKSGGNLFHSFEQFSIPTNNTAYFNNTENIQNIITRVTGGGSISNIDGLIKADGTANFFLLNPNGIIFGPNATLNIGGSFVASTASSLKFADGNQFSAVNSNTPPLLTISVPIGLQFGSNPGRILVQGDGNGIRLSDDLIEPNVGGLRVQPNQTLALVGGDVSLEGGTLKTAGGRIELGSVGADSFVTLNSIDKGYTLSYDSISTFKDIQLSGRAAVDASGEGGGDISVRGFRVMLKDGSQIESSTLRDKSGGTLRVIASNSVELMGGTELDGNFVFSALGTRVYSEATGAGGNLTLETGQLIVRDGAYVSTGTDGSGKGGTLAVKARESVELIGSSEDSQSYSGLFSTVSSTATGDGGNLILETGRLIVRDGAYVSTGTDGSGKGGTLAVKARESVELIGSSEDGQSYSGLFSTVSSTATGDGGNLILETGRLIVRDGSVIRTDTYSPVLGGNLTIKARESVELSGISAKDGFSSQLSTSVQQGATGAGGNLTLETGRLIAQDGAYVSTATFGSGAAGKLTVTASDSVELSGTSTSSDRGSGLFTSVQENATGAGGELILETPRLILREGAVVSAGTLGKGPAGNLEVRARDSVELIGTSKDGKFPSRLSARSTDTANAGDLKIYTGQLRVRDGAQVTVSSEGTGNAGNLRVEADSIFLDNQGKLTASTASGEGGNIDLQVRDLILMRRNSLISAEARNNANGGNITINSPNSPQGFIVAVRNENSDIVANASEGRGGTIKIYTNGVYGPENRSQLPPNSEISEINASSNVEGQQGVVEINTLYTDPTLGLVNLPVEIVEPKLDQSCQVGNSQNRSSFVVTGRGGLAPSPTELLSSDAVIANWITLNPARETPSSATASKNSTLTTPAPIVEATGWVRNSQGEVILTAHPPASTLHNSWSPTTDCHAASSTP